MGWARDKGIIRYAIAVLAVAVAVAVRTPFDPALGLKVPFITFFPAVMIAAWWGGLAAGLLATILSALAVVYVWMAPAGALTLVVWSDWVALALFVGIGAMMSVLADMLRRVETRLGTANDELRTLNEELTVANEELQANGSQMEETLAELEAAQDHLATVNAELTAVNAQIRASEERQRFLAEASTRLARSLDLEATIRGLSEAIVPRLADGYALDLLQEDGTLERAALVNVDPRRADPALEFARSHPGRIEDEHHPAGRAIRTGKPVLLPELTDATLESMAGEPALCEAFRRIAPRSYMVLPLLARARVLGTLSLGIHQSDRRYGEADLALAEDLAQRAAFAIDNARLFRQAQQAIREALAATRARDAFLARASHELRTPLTAALGTLRLLQRAMEGTLKESPETLVHIASRNLEVMARLVSDLLDVAKLTAGAETLVREPVDLRALVDDTAKTVGPLARQKGVGMESTVPAGLHVSGDRFKLEQVLLNLLGNAIKFTPAGGKVLAEGETDGAEVVLRVRDTGEGIGSEDLERIFDPFSQAAVPGGRQRGTGLGLTIARQLLTLHGGRIWAESKGLGKGATFVVRLPTASGAAS